MKEYTLPYGKSHLTFALPDELSVDLLMPQIITPEQDIDRVIIQALENPLGQKNLSRFRKDSTIGIAINDKTRPLPQPNPLNHLLRHLDNLEFARDNITLFIGSGTHLPMQADELPVIFDDWVIAHYHIVPHDCDHSPMVDLGKTSHKTPVRINQAFANCEIKITVGNIEPHHFMGYSGGVKTAAIGLAGRDTINANHAMLTRENTRTGLYHVNPMRQDIEEIGERIGIQFCLGTVINEQKEIIRVCFGEPKTVMLKVIPIIREMFNISVSEPYDLVIASPGGSPKDINLYQAQKGLTHAARIAKDGGWVLLLAACPEGSGSQSYEDYVRSMLSHQDIIQHFKNGFFQVGPHKAYQIAKDASRVKVILVSEIPPLKVQQWQLTPSQPNKLDPLLDWIAHQLPAGARVALMPAATRTMTEVKK